MSKSSIILFTFTLAALSVLVMFHRKDLNETMVHSKHEMNDSTNSRIETVAVSALKRIQEVDNIIKREKEKESALINESNRIKDSISQVDKRYSELKRKSENEKRYLKEKYERHIETIYKENCLSRGGPEDTVSSELR